ncbi:hypothetical protein [Methylobacterium fujisawaense]|uniref:hypothetical protein n=1 Tax=Methylobacterium fujisawaense TaxID=107400 RepID=UPI0037035E30
MTIAQDIENAPPAAPTLALIHTTTVEKFRKIFAQGAVIPQRCPVMDADLTYFFYGRPAFRPGRIDRTDRNPDSRPVCLVFKREAVPPGADIYPLDTGAHHERRYSPHLDGVTFADLECSSVPDAEGRIVYRYFENNEDYFYGSERQNLEPGATSAVAKGFFGFLVDSSRMNYDDRSRTVEIIHDQNINLSATLCGVILPDFLLHETEIAAWADACKAAGIQVKKYRPQSQTCAAREVERRFPEIADIQGIPL